MSVHYGQKRGISSVVGTVFSIIALASVVTYVTYSLDILDDFNQSVLAKNEETLDRGKEKFDVLSATIDSNKFNITISNTGTLPIEITKMWVQNKSATDWVNGYDIKKAVAPDGILTKIGQSSSIYANTANAYDIRLVTSRGNVQEFSVNSGNTEPLDLQLFVLPGTVPSGFTTTVLLTVTNNMSSNKILTNLVPIISAPPGSASVILQSGPNPPKYDTLLKGDTAYFKWIYKVIGDTGETVTFTASLQNGYPENDVSDTVTLSDVIFAIQSGASVETQGITVPPTADDILVLHLETGDALNGRQMYSGNAEANGLSIDTGTAITNTFYTKNDTAVLVNDGNWNASLRYISKPLPNSIGTPADLIYHFESNNLQKTLDSSGNTRDMNIAGTPQFGNYGQHSTNAFKFNGVDQYLYGSSTLNSHDDIKEYPDATAGWFKAASTQNVKSIIYRVGNNPSGEYYEISLGNGIPANKGKLYFNYTTKTPIDPSTPQGLCESSSSILNNGNWHHFVAVRNNEFDCKLYINGTLTLGGQDATPTCGSCTGQGANKIDVSGPANIGRNPATGEYFNGQIDGLFHWNSGSSPLSAKNALDLFNADYGPNAHKMTFKYEETDNLGNNPQLIKQDANYVLPFHDGKGDPSAWATNYNYTTTIPDLLIDVENRLKFNFTWNSGLNMTLRIDDSNLNNPKSTYIQMPNTTSSFPSYFEYKTSTFPSIKIYNKGPYSSWLTYLSRLTFDNINSNSSYAAHIKKVEGESLNTGIETDSILLQVNKTYTMEYQKPRSIPDATNQQNSNNLIKSGQYRMYVFFSGYDEQGNIFLRTVYFGIVRVVDDWGT